MAVIAEALFPRRTSVLGTNRVPSTVAAKGFEAISFGAIGFRGGGYDRFIYIDGTQPRWGTPEQLMIPALNADGYAIGLAIVDPIDFVPDQRPRDGATIHSGILLLIGSPTVPPAIGLSAGGKLFYLYMVATTGDLCFGSRDDWLSSDRTTILAPSNPGGAQLGRLSGLSVLGTVTRPENSDLEYGGSVVIESAGRSAGIGFINQNETRAVVLVIDEQGEVLFRPYQDYEAWATA